MKVVLKFGETIAVGDLSFKQWREFMAEYLRTNPYAERAWDVLTCLRGPDSPSERPDMEAEEHQRAYRGRRARKYDTVEIIRHNAFFGYTGGSARSHEEKEVRLPPAREWDHFDKHVARAANALGLKVVQR